MNELIVAEKLDPEKVFSEKGMQPVLDEIKKKVRAHKPDASTESGRGRIVSLAYKVSRSKTLLEGMGDTLAAGWKAKVKAHNGVMKNMRTFLDTLRDDTRQPVTEWEAAEELRQEEAGRLEKEKTQTRVDDLFKFDVVLPFTDVAVMGDEMYLSTLASAQETYNAEQKRLADEEAARQAEAKVLAEEKAHQAKVAAEQKKAQDKIDEENRGIEDERKKIIAEKYAIQAAKQAEIERKDREAFEKEATEKAKAKAEKDAKEAAEREKLEEEKQVEAEAAEKERQEALKPDKEKLASWILLFNESNIPKPKLKTVGAQDLFDEIEGELEIFLQEIEEKIEAL